MTQLRLWFDTRRLFSAAARVALKRPEEVRKLVKDATVSNSELTTAGFMFREHYRDQYKPKVLRQELERAGLRLIRLQARWRFSCVFTQPQRHTASPILAIGPIPNPPSNVRTQTITDTGPTTSALTVADRL